jgi:uncharacterized protein (PEP-CTERM system associated)
MRARKPESGPAGGVPALGALLPLALLLAPQAQAQSGGGGLTLQPRLSLSQTVTDNLNLRSTGGKDAALITTVAPGISLSHNGGRLRGALDYTANGLIYTKSATPNTVQNSLSARLSLSALDNWLSVDSRASISQQTISAFGPQAGDSALRSGNSTELATLGLTPSVKGQLAGLLSYQARASFTQTRAKDSIAGDGSGQELALNIAGLGARQLNWSAALSRQDQSPRAGRETQNTSATATLTYRPDFEWNVGLTAGQERTDYASLQARSHATYGVNGNWTPTPRTKLLASWQRHDYGNSHSLSFEHRMARSVWRFSDTQSVSNGGLQQPGTVLSNYELFFIQFASLEPDPVKRDLLVRSFLAQAGLNPTAPSTGGFLGNSTSLSRSQAFSMALQGQRTTLTMSLNQSRSSRLAQSSPAVPDDLSGSSVVRQRGAAVNLSHRLTPTSSATLALSQQQTRGDLSSQRSDLKSLTANWSGRLGTRSSINLGLRHSRFAGVTSYRENAVLATLVQQF